MEEVVTLLHPRLPCSRRHKQLTHEPNQSTQLPCLHLHKSSIVRSRVCWKECRKWLVRRFRFPEGLMTSDFPTESVRVLRVTQKVCRESGHTFPEHFFVSVLRTR